MVFFQNKFIISFIIPMNFVSVLSAQVSLWTNTGSYGNSLRPGSVINVKVNEAFRININSKWNVSSKAELNLLPDTKTLPFLSTSEQSKNRNKNVSATHRIKDILSFNLQAVIGQPQQGSGLYPIQATRSILIDLKPTQITLSGLVDPKYVQNDVVASSHIVNLQLTVRTQPPFERDGSIQLKPPRPEEITDPNNVPPNQAKLSEQEKQNILLKHLQEIIGLLNQ